MAEEKAAELDNKVRVGAVIRARDITLAALNANSKPVSRVKNAARLRVDFVLTANELATPGEKTIYVRITSPDGYVLTTEAMPTFDFEGERLSYSAMREVDYQNQDLDVGHLLQQHRIRRRHLHRAALLRRPPDRHLANRHALTAAPGSGNPPDPGQPARTCNSRSPRDREFCFPSTSYPRSEEHEEGTQQRRRTAAARTAYRKGKGAQAQRNGQERNRGGGQRKTAPKRNK